MYNVLQQSTQATVVVQQQPVVTVAPNFRDYPVTVTDSNGQQVQCDWVHFMLAHTYTCTCTVHVNT